MELFRKTKKEFESKLDKKINMGKNEFHVIVKRELTKGVYQIVADFDAIQDKGPDTNLVIVNKNQDFKEDLMIEESAVIAKLKYKLELLNIDPEEAIEKVKQRILLVQTQIKDINDNKGYLLHNYSIKIVKKEEQKEADGPKKKEISVDVKPGVETIKEEKVLKKSESDLGIEIVKTELLDDDKKATRKLVNVLDFEDEERELKVLKNCLENCGDGSYIEINEKGQKQVQYKHASGIFIPIKHITTPEGVSLYPNEGANKKRFYSEQYLIDKEFQEDANSLLGSKLDKLLKFAVVIILALEIFGAIYLMNGFATYHKQVDQSFISTMEAKAIGSSIDCAYYYSLIMRTDFDVIQHFNDRLMNKTEEGGQANKQENFIIDMKSKLLAMS